MAPYGPYGEAISFNPKMELVPGYHGEDNLLYKLEIGRLLGRPNKTLV